jgi:hypothetical protein
MRTFVFNLTLLCLCILAAVLLMRPLVAAYDLATKPLAPMPQPSVIAPEQPSIEYGADYYADFEFMPAGLSELPPVANN